MSIVDAREQQRTGTSLSVITDKNLGASSSRKMSAAPKRLSSPKDYQDLIDRYDTWLFDCDGVLWRGTTLIDGAKEFLQLLRSKSQSLSLMHPKKVLTENIE